MDVPIQALATLGRAKLEPVTAQDLATLGPSKPETEIHRKPLTRWEPNISAASRL